MSIMSNNDSDTETSQPKVHVHHHHHNHHPHHHVPQRRASINQQIEARIVKAKDEESFKGDKTYDWFEIFVNLFYLAFLIKLGDIFLYCKHSVEIYMYTIAMFLGIYMNKFEMDLYLSKYGFNDIANKVFLVVYATGIFFMILNVNATTVEHGNSGTTSSLVMNFHQECHEYRGYVVGFSIGWIITRGSILIMYLAISRTLSDKYMLVSKIPILSISLLIVMLNLIMRDDRYDNDYSSVKFLLAAALVEFLGFALWQMYIVGTLLHPYLQHTMATVKVNIHRQSTRTAAFGVVTLGVSVVELMTPVLHSSGAHHYLSLFLGFVIILSLTLNFFDVIPSKGSIHALSISKLQGTAWMLMQPVLSYCIFGVGMIIKMLLAEDIDDTLHEQESDRTLGIFLGLASILLLLIRLTHRTKWTMTTARWVTAFCRLVIALGHLLVGFYLGHPMNVQVSLYSHAALCVAYVLIDALKYHGKDFLYLKIWSASAREDEDSVIIVESQHEEDDLTLSSTVHSVKGSDSVVVLNRNLSEAKILIPEGLNDRKIQIPRRFASSSSIPGIVGGIGGAADLNGTKRIQVQRRPSDGKILLPRKHSEGKILLSRRPSEGKILLPRRPSEGKISLTRIQSEGKIQLPRTMSSSSFMTRSNSRNLLSGDDGERVKVKRVGNVKRKTLDVATGLRAPVTVTSPSNHINISRQYKSSTDIGHSRISAGQIRSISSLSSSTTSSPIPHGAVVKNDKGQFVLEQVVPTEDGGTRVQHTVLQRVVTKKSKKATEGLGSGSFSSSDIIPSSIVVRRVKSSGNVSKGDISDIDSAKLALQSSSSDSEDFGVENSKESDERGTVNDIKESEVNPVVKKSLSITSLQTIDTFNSSKTGLCDEGDRSVGSSVVLVDDEKTDSANGALPLTKLSRSASLTLSDSGRSDSFIISERK